MLTYIDRLLDVWDRHGSASDPTTWQLHDAKPSTWQHTTLTTERHPCLRRDSNPQYQQASGRRPTP